MRSNPFLFALLFGALAVSGCSSRPRYFTASLNPPTADAPSFERDMALCRNLVAQGNRSGFKTAALKIGGGAVAGIGSGVAIAAVAPLTVTTIGVASYAMPVVGFAAGFGISRAIRSGREKKLKQALANCLAEYGYAVEQWTPTKRPKTMSLSQQPSDAAGL
jgi:hypothetical protein